MDAIIRTRSGNYSVNFSEPIDISIPLRAGKQGVNAFHAPPFETSPVKSGTFVGSVKEGGYLNFINVKLNPHGNGTHTECVGHIADGYTINRCLKKFLFVAELTSVYPTKQNNGDEIIFKHDIEKALGEKNPEAIIIRTLPNDALKLKANYSGRNPPYFHHEAAAFLVNKKINHVLVDLPSMDREEDGGKLLFHKTFWQFPDAIREEATITELIFVPNEIPDGSYLLNLQVASFELDASPSKPVLYKMDKMTK